MTEHLFPDYGTSPILFTCSNTVTKSIANCSHHLAKTLGYQSNQDLIGKSMVTIYHPDCHSLMADYYEEWLRFGAFESMNLCLVTKDRVKIPVYAKVSTITDILTGTKYTSAFLTDLRPIYDSLAQQVQPAAAGLPISNSTAAVNWMSYFLHEINNSLGIVELYCEHLGHLLTDKKMDLEQITYVHKKMAKASHFAGQVSKNFSRLAKKKWQDSESLCRPHEQIEDLISLLSPQISSKDLKLEIEWGKDIPKNICTKISGTHLSQVVFNLILNSFEALKSNKDLSAKIRVFTQMQNGFFSVTVEDNGPGVPSENIDQLFTANFSTKKVNELSGIGLYYAKQLVEIYGGQLRFEQTPGQTRFTVLLRIYEQDDKDSLLQHP